MTRRIAFISAVILFAASSLASAQTFRWRDQSFININAGAQPRVVNDTSRFEFTVFDETASVDVARKLKGKSYIDVTAGTTPLRRYGVAVNYLQRTAKSNGSLAASIPDPAYYDSPASLSGTIDGMQHTETWFAGLVAIRLPRVSKLDMMALVGPAFVKVKHEVVTAVAVDGFTGSVAADLSILSRNLLGYQAGLDVRYPLMRVLGVGGFVRVSKANGNLGPDVKANLGGLQFGGGVQVRF